jgi:hypothetical protein
MLAYIAVENRSRVVMSSDAARINGKAKFPGGNAWLLIAESGPGFEKA